MKRVKLKKRLVLLGAVYALALVVWLCCGGVLLARDTQRAAGGELVRRELTLDDFEQTSGILMDHNNWFSTSDPDAWLLYTPQDGEVVNNIVIDATPISRASGMALYYTTEQGEPFSEANKIWPSQSENGGWWFDVGGVQAASIRWDPDSLGGVHWQVHGIVLNEALPPQAYFVPSAQQWVMLFVVPLVLWAVLCEVVVFIRPIVKKRRAHSKQLKQQDAE